MMKKVLLHALCLLLCAALCLPAYAEDCFTIDVDTLDLDRLNSDDYVARSLSASTQGIRVRKQLTQSSETASAVRLTLTQMDTKTLLFDRDYGYQSGTFDSGVIYLPYAGDAAIPYLVTLYAGDMVYAMPFMHLQRRLTYNGACTRGAALRDLNLGGDWLMGTVVNLDDLRLRGSMSVEVCASNQYIIGTAHVSMSGDSLCVELLLEPQANAEVHQASLYVVTNASDFHNAPAFRLGDWVNVGGAESALIYLPMQVSYDPAGLRTASYSVNDPDVQRQLQLWQQNAGVGQKNGWSEPETADDSWNADSGWDDGWSSGWDDGWSSGW